MKYIRNEREKNMKRKFYLINTFILLFLASSALYSQSAKVLDRIISTEALTCGDACYLAGIMAGRVADDTTSKDAMEFFSYIKALKDAKVDDIIRYDVFATLVMDAGEVKDSIWYNLYKTPHYAFRYLKTEGLVSDATAPSGKVNPRDAIAIISKLSEVK